jgi:hypothetical protein
VCQSMSEGRSLLYVLRDMGRQSNNPSIRNQIETQACPLISVAEELLIYIYLRMVRNGPHSARGRIQPCLIPASVVCLHSAMSHTRIRSMSAFVAVSVAVSVSISVSVVCLHS